MLAINMTSIIKKYKGAIKPAVNNLSLQVKKGEIVTLLGPSGCGKTTTLRLIAGFERADDGSISLGGKVVSDKITWVPPERRGVGMVFQDYALFPHLNIFDNVGFGYKGKDKYERVMEIINLVNLKGYEKRFPHELSGGQQQRVALARALTGRPVVVLLDEPFSNLDADLRVCMRTEVKRIIKEAGATAILVSHDQKDALAISDRIVVMKDGIVQQIGTPKEIYQFPANSFVATFVGQSNLLTGKIGEDGISVITGIGAIPCYHTHDKKAGEKVCVSIRPDSLEMDKKGKIRGIIKDLTYTGESYDAIVETISEDGTKQDLLTHIHPEEDVKIGDVIRLTALPNFIAVINQ